MAAIIENWVKLKVGIPKRVHFVNHAIETRRIMDPVMKMLKDIQAVVFAVDREDGVAVSKSFSIVSEKLATELGAYLEGKRYVGYEFTFIKDAPGFVAPRIVSVEPYPK